MERHKFIPKPILVDKSHQILSLVKGRKTLHIGMGGYIDDDAHTEQIFSGDLSKAFHAELASWASELYGLDINPKAVAAMSKAVPGRYFTCDVCAPTLPQDLAAERFQVIVLADVIEHLDNFAAALRNLKFLLAPGGILIVSTSNAFSFDAIFKMLLRYEATHDEHTCHFSYLTLKRTLAMNGMSMEGFVFYTHKNLSVWDGWMHRLGHYVGNVVSALFPQFARGIIAVARPIE